MLAHCRNGLVVASFAALVFAGGCQSSAPPTQRTVATIAPVADAPQGMVELQLDLVSAGGQTRPIGPARQLSVGENALPIFVGVTSMHGDRIIYTANAQPHHLRGGPSLVPWSTADAGSAEP